MKVGDTVLAVREWPICAKPVTVERVSKLRITTSDGRQWSRKTLRCIGYPNWRIKVPTSAELDKARREQKQEELYGRLQVAGRRIALHNNERFGEIVLQLETLAAEK